MFNSGYIDSDNGTSLDRNGHRKFNKKRMNDGTSNKEIVKAMQTYLNRTHWIQVHFFLIQSAETEEQ